MSEPIPPTPKRRGGNPNMRAGGPSLNPHGRPKRGLSLAEAIRERVDPAWIAERAVALAETAESEATRLAALSLIADRGWGKPLSTVEVTASIDARAAAVVAPLNWGNVPLEQRKAALEALRAARAAGALPPADEPQARDLATPSDD